MAQGWNKKRPFLIPLKEVVKNKPTQDGLPRKENVEGKPETSIGPEN